MRGITGRTTRTIVLLAALLMMVPGQQSLHLLPRPAALSESPTVPATVTAPAPENPVSVSPATGTYVDGVGNAVAPASSAAGKKLPSDVLAAYTLAIAVAPPGCHLSLPLLAAIGQVESGNLAGHSVDSRNRVSPTIIGPVLNGKGDVRAVADTDGGQWDGSKRWDRALGPFQFIPSSWRVAGVDMDADGVRDPQNIFDSAGAAMVYLCAGGRDLATAAGLRQGVLSYNHSVSYLELVLAWKAVLEDADLSGVGEPTVYGAWALPTAQTAPVDLSTGAGTPRHLGRHTVKHSTPKQSATKQSTPTEPSAPTTPTKPTTPNATPSAEPSAGPAPSQPTQPTQPATPTTPTKGPDPTTPAEPLPTCPVPTEDPTASPTPGTPATPVEPTTPVAQPGEVVVDPTDPDATCVMPVDPEAQTPAPTPAP